MVAALAQKLDASLVVVDFSPLRLARSWREQLAASLKDTPIDECDAHNVVCLLFPRQLRLGLILLAGPVLACIVKAGSWSPHFEAQAVGCSKRLSG